MTKFLCYCIILLPMSGCFDGAVGDAEGTDDASENGDSSGGDGTSTGTSSSTQARTWYSSGGTYDTYWEDGHYTGYYTNDGDVYMGTGYEYDNNDHTYRYMSQVAKGVSIGDHTTIRLENFWVKDAMNGDILNLNPSGI